MRFYGPTSWLHYYDTQLILCTGYYTSHCIQLERKQPDAHHCMVPFTLWSILLIPLDCTLPACVTIRSQLLSMAHSQPAQLMLPSTPPSTFSGTLPGMLTKTLPIAPDGTLTACLTVCSEVCSQDALKHTSNCTRWHIPSLLHYTLPSKLSRHAYEYWICTQVHLQVALKYTPKYALKYTPNCSQWLAPSLLNCTLSSKLARRSQAHSQARSQVDSQLRWIIHSQPPGLYAPKSALKTLPRTPPSTHPGKPLSRSQVYFWVRSQVHS